MSDQKKVLVVPKNLKEFLMLTMFQKQRLYKERPDLYKKFNESANKNFSTETDTEAANILNGKD